MQRGHAPAPHGRKARHWVEVRGESQSWSVKGRGFEPEHLNHIPSPGSCEATTGRHREPGTWHTADPQSAVAGLEALEDRRTERRFDFSSRDMGTGQRPGLGVTGSAPTPGATRAQLGPVPGLFLSGNHLRSVAGGPRNDRTRRAGPGEQLGSRRGFPLQPGREAELGREGRALSPHAALTCPPGSVQAEPGSKLLALPPRPVRRVPAHFAPEVGRFRLAAS